MALVNRNFQRLHNVLLPLACLSPVLHLPEVFILVGVCVADHCLFTSFGYVHSLLGVWILLFQSAGLSVASVSILLCSLQWYVTTTPHSQSHSNLSVTVRHLHDVEQRLLQGPHLE